MGKLIGMASKSREMAYLPLGMFVCRCNVFFDRVEGGPDKGQGGMCCEPRGGLCSPQERSRISHFCPTARRCRVFASPRSHVPINKISPLSLSM